MWSQCSHRSDDDCRLRLRGSGNFTRLKPETIHVGDFVHCRSKYYRDQLELPAEFGLVIEIKRSNFKVLYSNDKRCWLPRETIVRMKPDLDYGTFAGKLHYIIKKVHALEC